METKIKTKQAKFKKPNLFFASPEELDGLLEYHNSKPEGVDLKEEEIEFRILEKMEGEARPKSTLPTKPIEPVKKPTLISVKKFDKVKTSINGIEGIVVKYSSNTDITLQSQDGDTMKISREDIIQVISSNNLPPKPEPKAQIVKALPFQIKKGDRVELMNTVVGFITKYNDNNHIEVTEQETMGEATFKDFVSKSFITFNFTTNQSNPSVGV